MRVLDIGCADGFFSVELARRGAREVIAADMRRNRLRRVEFVKSVLGLDAIKPRLLSIYELTPELGPFDLILMLALLYHLDAPLTAIEKMTELSGVLYLESITVDDDERSYLELRKPGELVPKLAKWVPSKRCVREMLTIAGFNDVTELPYEQQNRSLYLGRRT